MICPFCGDDEKATREHVFGQQFARRFPSVAEHIAAVGDYADPWLHDEVVKTADGYITRQVARGALTPELHQVQVKVGAKCNAGWMADLDNEAVDVLDALTAGGGFMTPTSHEAGALARWLVKMGMAYDLFLPPAERGYSPSLRREFFATRVLPQGTTVYLGYEPEYPRWVPFWQHGWHVAPVGTSDEKILTSPPNLSTTFFGLNGLRLVAHRIAPDVASETRVPLTEWLDYWMGESRMVQITPRPSEAEFEQMDPRTVELGMYTLREFVDRHTVHVAPGER